MSGIALPTTRAAGEIFRVGLTMSAFRARVVGSLHELFTARRSDDFTAAPSRPLNLGPGVEPVHTPGRGRTALAVECARAGSS